MSEPFHHTLTEGNGIATVVAYNPDGNDALYSASASHPNWRDIVAGLKNGDPNVWELFDISKTLINRVSQVTDRVSWNGEDVLWDGDPIHTSLADHLKRTIESGEADNFTALAKFWEKLESNPDAHSREQAYDWLAAHKFQITVDGDVVGYKGVSSDGQGGYRSGFSSAVPDKPSAYVDGVPVPPLSHVPNKVGSVVTMPRSEVVHDPRKACERGLHVSTRSFAESYAHGGAMLEVHVNPRDIVSVPTDGGGRKVRVCRYSIARIAVDDTGDSPVLTPQTEKVWAGDVGYKV